MNIGKSSVKRKQAKETDSYCNDQNCSTKSSDSIIEYCSCSSKEEIQLGTQIPLRKPWDLERFPQGSNNNIIDLNCFNGPYYFPEDHIERYPEFEIVNYEDVCRNFEIEPAYENITQQFPDIYEDEVKLEHLIDGDLFLANVAVVYEVDENVLNPHCHQLRSSPFESLIPFTKEVHHYQGYPESLDEYEQSEGLKEYFTSKSSQILNKQSTQNKQIFINQLSNIFPQEDGRLIEDHETEQLFYPQYIDHPVSKEFCRPRNCQFICPNAIYKRPSKIPTLQTKKDSRSSNFKNYRVEVTSTDLRPIVSGEPELRPIERAEHFLGSKWPVEEINFSDFKPFVGTNKEAKSREVFDKDVTSKRPTEKLKKIDFIEPQKEKLDNISIREVEQSFLKDLEKQGIFPTQEMVAKWAIEISLEEPQSSEKPQDILSKLIWVDRIPRGIKELIPRKYRGDVDYDPTFDDDCAGTEKCSCDVNKIIVKQPIDSPWVFPSALIVDKQWFTIPYERKVYKKGTLKETPLHFRPQIKIYKKDQLVHLKALKSEKVIKKSMHPTKIKETTEAIPARSMLADEIIADGEIASYHLAMEKTLEPEAKRRKPKKSGYEFDKIKGEKRSDTTSKMASKKILQTDATNPQKIQLDKISILEVEQSFLKDLETQGIFPTQEMVAKWAIEISLEEPQSSEKPQDILSKLIWVDRIPRGIKELIPRKYRGEVDYDPTFDDDCTGTEKCSCDVNKIIVKQPIDSPWVFPSALIVDKQWFTIPYERKVYKKGTLKETPLHFRPQIKIYKKDQLVHLKALKSEKVIKKSMHPTKIKETTEAIPARSMLADEIIADGEIASYHLAMEKTLEPEAKRRKPKKSGYEFDKIKGEKRSDTTSKMASKKILQTDATNPQKIQLDKISILEVEQSFLKDLETQGIFPTQEMVAKWAIEISLEEPQSSEKPQDILSKLIWVDRIPRGIKELIPRKYRGEVDYDPTFDDDCTGTEKCSCDVNKIIVKQPIDSPWVFPSALIVDKQWFTIPYERKVYTKGTLKETPLHFRPQIKIYKKDQLVHLKALKSEKVIKKSMHPTKIKETTEAIPLLPILADEINQDGKIASYHLPMKRTLEPEAKERKPKKIGYEFDKIKLEKRAEMTTKMASKKIKQTDATEPQKIQLDKISIVEIEKVFLKDLEKQGIFPMDEKDAKWIMELSLEDCQDSEKPRDTVSKLIWIDKIPRGIGELIPRGYKTDVDYDLTFDEDCSGKAICSCDANKIIMKKPIDLPLEFSSAILPEKEWFTIPYERTLNDGQLYYRPHINIYKNDQLVRSKIVGPEKATKKPMHLAKIKETTEAVPEFSTLADEVELYDEMTKYQLVMRRTLEPKTKGNKFKQPGYKRWDSFYRYKFGTIYPKIEKQVDNLMRNRWSAEGINLLDFKLNEVINKEARHHELSDLYMTPKLAEEKMKETEFIESQKEQIDKISMEEVEQAFLKDLAKQRILPTDDKLAKWVIEISLQDAKTSEKPQGILSKSILVDKIPRGIRELIPRSYHADVDYDPTFDKDCSGVERCSCDLNKIIVKNFIDPPWVFPSAFFFEKQWFAIPYERKAGQERILKDGQLYFRPHIEIYKYDRNARSRVIKDEEITEKAEYPHKITDTIEAIPKISMHADEIESYGKLASQQLTMKSTLESKEKGKQFRQHGYNRWDSFYRNEFDKIESEREKKNLEPAYRKVPLQKQFVEYYNIKGEKPKKERKDISYQRGTIKEVIVEKPTIGNEIEPPLLSVAESEILEAERQIKIPQYQRAIRKRFTFHEPIETINYSEESARQIESAYCLEELESQTIKPFDGRESLLSQQRGKPEHVLIKLIAAEKIPLEKPQKVKNIFKQADSFNIYKKKASEKVLDALIYEKVSINKLSVEDAEYCTKLKEQRSYRINRSFKMYGKHEDMGLQKSVYEKATKSKLQEENTTFGSKKKAFKTKLPERYDKSKKPLFERLDSFYRYDKKIIDKDINKTIYDKYKATKHTDETPKSITEHKHPIFNWIEKVYRHRKWEEDKSKMKPIYLTAVKTKLTPERASYIPIPISKLPKEEPISASQLKTSKYEKVDWAYEQKKEEEDKLKEKRNYDLERKSKTPLEKQDSLSKIIKPPFHRVGSIYKYEPKDKEKVSKDTVYKTATISKLRQDPPIPTSKLKDLKSEEVDLAYKHKKVDDKLEKPAIHTLALKSNTKPDIPDSLAKVKEPPFDRIDSFYKYVPKDKEKVSKDNVYKTATISKLRQEPPIPTSKLKDLKSEEIDLAYKHKKADDKLKTTAIQALALKTNTKPEIPDSLAKVKELPFDRVDSFYKYVPKDKEKVSKDNIYKTAMISKLRQEPPIHASKLKGLKSDEVDLAYKHKKTVDKLETTGIHALVKKSKTVPEIPESLAKVKEPPFDRVDSFYKYVPKDKEKVSKDNIYKTATISKLRQEPPIHASKLKGLKSDEVDLAYKHKKADDKLETTGIHALVKKSKTMPEIPDFLTKVREPPFDRVDSFYKYVPKDKEKVSKDTIYKTATISKLQQELPIPTSKLKDLKSEKVDLAYKHKKADDKLETTAIHALVKKTKTMPEIPDSLAKVKEPPFDRVDSFYRYVPKDKEKVSKDTIYKTATISKLRQELPIPTSKLKDLKSEKVDLAYKHKKADDKLETTAIHALVKKTKTMPEIPDSLAKVKEPPFDRVDSFYKYVPKDKEKVSKDTIYKTATISKLQQELPIPTSKLKDLKSEKVDLAYKHKKTDDKLETTAIHALVKKTKTMPEIPDSLAKVKEPPFDRVDSFYKYVPKDKEKVSKDTIYKTATISKLQQELPIPTSKLKDLKSEKVDLAYKHKKADDKLETTAIHALVKKSKTMPEIPDSLAKVKEPPFDRVDSFYRYVAKDKEKVSKDTIYKTATISKLQQELPIPTSKLKDLKSEKVDLAYKHKKADDKLETTAIHALVKKSKTMPEIPDSLAKVKEPPFDRVDSFYRYVPKDKEKVSKDTIYKTATISKLQQELPIPTSKLKDLKSEKVDLAYKHKKADDKLETTAIHALVKKTKTMPEIPDSLAKVKEPPFDRVDSFYKYVPKDKEKVSKDTIYKTATISKLQQELPIPTSKLKDLKSEKVDLAYKHKKADDKLETTAIHALVKKSKTMPEIPDSLAKVKEPPFDRVDSFYRYVAKDKEKVSKDTIYKTATISKLQQELPIPTSKLKDLKSEKVDLAYKHKKADDKLETTAIHALVKKSKTMPEIPDSLAKVKEPPFDRVDSFYKYIPKDKEKVSKDTIYKTATISKLRQELPIPTSKLKDLKSEKVDLAYKHKKADDKLETTAIHALVKKTKTMPEIPDSLAKVKEPPFDRVDSFYRYVPKDKEKVSKDTIYKTATISKLQQELPIPTSKLKDLKSEKVDLAYKHKKADDKLETTAIHALVKKSKTMPEIPDSLAKVKEPPFDRVDSFYRYVPKDKEKVSKDTIYKTATISKLQQELPIPTSKLKDLTSEKVDLAYKHKKADDKLETTAIHALVKKSKTMPEIPDFLTKVKELPFDRVDSFYKYVPKDKEKVSKDTIYKTATISKLQQELPIPTSKLKDLKSEKVDLAYKHKKSDDKLETTAIHTLVKKSKTMPEIPDFLTKVREPPFDRVDSFYKYVPKDKEKVSKDTIYKTATISKLQQELPIPTSKLKDLKSEKVDLAYKHKKADDKLETTAIHALVKKSKTMPEIPDSLAKVKEPPFDRVDSFYRYVPKDKEKVSKDTIYKTATISKLQQELPIPTSKLKDLKSEKVDLAYKHKKADDKLETTAIHALVKKSKTMPEIPDSLAKVKEPPFDRVDSFYRYVPKDKEKVSKDTIYKTATISKLQQELPIPTSKLKDLKSEKVDLAYKHKKADDKLETTAIHALVKKSKTMPEIPDSLAKVKEPLFDRVDSFYKYIPKDKEKVSKDTIYKTATISKLRQELPIPTSKLKDLKSEKVDLAYKHKKTDDKLETTAIHDLVKKSKTLPEIPDSLAKVKEPPFDRVDSFYKYIPKDKEKVSKDTVYKTATISKLQQELPIPTSKLKDLKSEEVDLAYKHKKADDKLETTGIHALVKKSKTVPEIPDSLAKVKEPPFDRVDSFYKYVPKDKEKVSKDTIYKTATISKLQQELPIPTSKLKDLKSEKVDLAYKYKKADDKLETTAIHALVKKSKTMPEIPDFLTKVKEPPFDRVDSFYKDVPKNKEKVSQDTVYKTATISKLRQEQPISASKLKGDKPEKMDLTYKHKKDDTMNTQPIYNLSKKSKITLGKPDSLSKIKELPFDHVDSFYKYGASGKENISKRLYETVTISKLPQEKPISASKLKSRKSEEVNMHYKHRKEDDEWKTQPSYDLARKSKTPQDKSDSLAKIKQPPFNRLDSFYKYEPKDEEKMPKIATYENVISSKLPKKKPKINTQIVSNIKRSYQSKEKERKIIATMPISEVVRKSVISFEKSVSRTKIKPSEFERVDSFYEYDTKENKKIFPEPVYERLVKTKLPKENSLSASKSKSSKACEIVLSFKYEQDSSDKINTKPIYNLATKTKSTLKKPESVQKMKYPSYNRIDSFYRFEKKVSDVILHIYDRATKSKLPKEKPLSASMIKSPIGDEIDLFYHHEKEIKVINYDRTIKSKRPIQAPESGIEFKRSLVYQIATQSKLAIDQPDSYENIRQKTKKVDSFYKYEPPKEKIKFEPIEFENVTRKKLPIEKPSRTPIKRAPESFIADSRYRQPDNVWMNLLVDKKKQGNKQTLPSETFKIRKPEKEEPIVKIRKQEPLWLDSEYIFQRSSVLKAMDPSMFQRRILHKQRNVQQAEFGVDFDEPNNVWINCIAQYQRVTYDDANIEEILNKADAFLPVSLKSESRFINFYAHSKTKSDTSE